MLPLVAQNRPTRPPLDSRAPVRFCSSPCRGGGGRRKGEREAEGDVHPEGRGVCMMSTSWRDKQQPSLINFIAAFLAANSYRLNFLSISPDFIFNNGGLSVAFVFETNWDCQNEDAVFSRVNRLKRQFKNLYVVVAVPTREQNESFNQSYHKLLSPLSAVPLVSLVGFGLYELGFPGVVKCVEIGLLELIHACILDSICL
ncbi:hypothetical protein ABZP36_007449 [Zizania latifolia]